MAAKVGDDLGALAEIDVTPLVDVMLVLLIIFIITAPMLVQGLQVDLPKQAAPARFTTARRQYFRRGSQRAAKDYCRDLSWRDRQYRRSYRRLSVRRGTLVFQPGLDSCLQRGSV